MPGFQLLWTTKYQLLKKIPNGKVYRFIITTQIYENGGMVLFWVKLKSANWFTVFASCQILIISHNSSRCANLDKML